VEVVDESPPMAPRDATAYRGITARLNYLAQDRADIQYACKEASRRMASPREADWLMPKRIARYLIGAPRFEQKFVWQDAPEKADAYTDSDWAGCRSTCRSTSGGALKLGEHCLKTWSSTQATVALSSAEAELYALTKGASQVLGLMSLLEDFGVVVSATVHTDASAAIGIVRRAGLGKLRHLNVRYLWLQDKVREEDFELLKVPGLANPADLMTKHLSRVDADRHLASLGMHLGSGRASTAPTLGKLEARGEGGHEVARRSNRFTKTHPTDFLSRNLRDLHPWLAISSRLDKTAWRTTWHGPSSERP
jgi:hypothetical protein